MYVKPTPLDMPLQVHLGQVPPAEVKRIRSAARGTRGGGRGKAGPIPAPMTPTPGRIRLSRARGWTLPVTAVVVSRPTRWGNPYKATDAGGNAPAVEQFRRFLAGDRRYLKDGKPTTYPSDAEIRRALAGRDLACWCRPDEQCHADVLLKIANEGVTP